MSSSRASNRRGIQIPSGSSSSERHKRKRVTDASEELNDDEQGYKEPFATDKDPIVVEDDRDGDASKDQDLPEATKNQGPEEVVAMEEEDKRSPIEPTTEIRFGGLDEPFAFLSTLFPSRIILDGIEFCCAEAIFRASVHRDADFKKKMIGAKWAGDILAEDTGWNDEASALSEDIQVESMRVALRLKFSQNTRLLVRLLQLKDVELIFKNADVFWGVNENGIGNNWLGNLLMEIRTELSTSMLALQSLPSKRGEEQTASTSFIWRIRSAVLKSVFGLPTHITLSPAIDTVDPKANIVLHSVVPGKEPNTLQVIVQIPRSGVQDVLIHGGVTGAQQRYQGWHDGDISLTLSSPLKSAGSSSSLTIDELQNIGDYQLGSEASFSLYRFTVLLLKQHAILNLTAQGKTTALSVRVTTKNK